MLRQPATAMRRSIGSWEVVTAKLVSLSSVPGQTYSRFKAQMRTATGLSGAPDSGLTESLREESAEW